jgi:hypothetical protein
VNRERWRGRARVLAAGAVVALYAVSTASNVLVNLTYDDGLYLAVSLLVAQGQVPYRDFFYPAPPVMAYLYAAVLTLFGPPYHVVAEAFSATLGLATGTLLFLISAKVAGRGAGFVCLAIVAFGWSWTSVAKLLGSVYFVTPFVFFVACGVYADLFVRPRRLGIVIASMCFSVAVGVRLVVAILVAYLLYLLVTERGWAALITSAAVMAVSSLLIGGYFAVHYFDETWASVIGWVTEVLPEKGFGRSPRVRLEQVLVVLGAFPHVYVGLLAIVLSGGLWRRLAAAEPLERRTYILTGLLTGGAAIMFFAVPVPARWHHVFYLPLAAVLMAVYVCRAVVPRLEHHELGGFLAATAALAMVWVPVIHHGGVIGLLGQLKRAGAGESLEQVVATIREETPANATVLSFSPYLPLWAGRRGLPGLEYSHVGFVPGWPTPRAERYRRYNEEMMVGWVTTRRADFVVITDMDREAFLFGSGPSGPAAWNSFETAIACHYGLVRTIYLDKAWGGVRFYRPKPAGAC